MDLDRELEADQNSRLTRLRKLQWYKGNINRNLAELLLKRSGSKTNGMFLIRQTKMCPRAYVLSFINSGTCHHFRIEELFGDHCFKLGDSKVTEGLDGLIEYHSSQEHGLPCRLSKPCPSSELPPAISVLTGCTNILHRAIYKDLKEEIGHILKHPKCPDINWKDDKGSAALHIASSRGQDEVLRMLLAHKAEVNILDHDGYTPLHRACQKNQPNIVKVLLKEGGVNPQIAHRPTGNVALHEAAKYGFTTVTKVLLQAHVPVWPRNGRDMIPSDLAIKHSKNETAQLLESYEPPPVTTKKEHWFHRKMKRDDAFRMLESLDLQDGYFLVRPSSRGEGSFCLNLCFKNKINNYIIENFKNKALFLTAGPILKTLEQFVEHYSKYIDGTACLLMYGIDEDGEVRSVKTNEVISPLVGQKELPSYDVVEVDQPSLPPRVKPPVANEYREISQKDLELGSELGQGEYGMVFSGVWTAEGKKHNIAVKTMNEEHMSEDSKESFLREAQLMVMFDHPCIVKLVGVCKGPPLMLIQELLPHGSLQDFMLDFQDRVDVKRDIFRWAAQVACGMNYLESKKLVHRDLATRNVLLEDKLQAKVGDFGMSRAVGENSDYYRATKGGRWPVKWYAPECMYYGTFSHASDVWSYGVTLWEMFTLGEQPYGEKTGAEVVEMIEKGNRLEKPNCCPDDVYQQMLKCWSYKPLDRPLFKALYDYFCSKISYTNVSLNYK